MKRKKVMSVILSAVMAVSLTVTTFAADAVPAAGTVTEESGETGGENATPAEDTSKTNQDETWNQQKAENTGNNQETPENKEAKVQENGNSNAKNDDKKRCQKRNKQ